MQKLKVELCQLYLYHHPSWVWANYLCTRVCTYQIMQLEFKQWKLKTEIEFFLEQAPLHIQLASEQNGEIICIQQACYYTEAAITICHWQCAKLQKLPRNKVILQSRINQTTIFAQGLIISMVYVRLLNGHLIFQRIRAMFLGFLQVTLGTFLYVNSCFILLFTSIEV